MTEKTIRVLVAEDNAMNSEIICRRLERRGYDVRAAFDGIETLRILNDYKPEFLLLDLDMPRLDGEGVLKELTHKLTGLPKIIVLTAFPDTLFVKNPHFDMVRATFPKPIPFEKLIDVMKEMQSI